MKQSLIPTFSSDRTALFREWLTQGKDFSKVEIMMQRRHSQSQSSGAREVAWSRRQIEQDGRYSAEEVEELIQNATRAGRYISDPNFLIANPFASASW